MATEPLFLYRGTHGDAVRLHEESLWEQSFRENVACARAIEKALRISYGSDDSIAPDCAARVLEAFGFKRVNYVLAYTVKDLEPPASMLEPCFSSENRDWAGSQRIVLDRDYGHYYCVDTAQMLLDEFIRQAREAYQALGLFEPKHCSLGMYDEDVEGRVLVMKPDTLKERCWSQENQLWLAQGGFGCKPEASGRAIYALCLSDGEQTRWNREDFMGVLDDKHLPAWASEKLEEIRSGQEQMMSL